MCLPQKVKAATIQRIASFVGSLLYLNFGLMFGITPTHTRLYQSLQTPLNRVIDEGQAAWVTDNLFLCAAIGALLFGLTLNRIGPKSLLLFSGLLQIISWFTIHFAFDIVHIYGSRVAAGLAAGAAFVVLPIFITEIAEEPNRAALIAFAEAWRALGILLGFMLATFVHYDYVNIAGVGVSVIFNLLFPFVQETPRYYQRKGNAAALEKSLRWYRGIRDLSDRQEPKFLDELKEFKATMSTQQTHSNSVGRLEATDATRKDHSRTTPFYIHLLHLVLICLVLAIGAQLTAGFVILNYTQEIFRNLRWAQWPEEWEGGVVALTLSAAQFVGAILAASLVEKINRKVLIIITTLVSSLSLASLALLIKFGSTWQLIPVHTPWLPLGLLFLHFLVANIGISSLASIIMMELLPAKFRMIFMSTMVTIFWILGFLLIKFFWALTSTITLVGCFSLFAGISIFLGLFTIIMLPETRHKSLEQVQQSMGYAEKVTKDNRTMKVANEIATIEAVNKSDY